jgi:anion-transporting  ArsA/GET3 family ATPase
MISAVSPPMATVAGIAAFTGGRRFLFITGKGGAGKTTVAAALALALAAQGRRVLIVMCNAKERLSSLFESRPVGHSIVALRRGVWATNITPELALREYGEMVLRIGSVARAVFENRFTRAFFRATPGLYEWAMLGKAWFHATERLPNGQYRFDVVLFDAPATGHGMDMLRVPKVILDVVPPGILRRDAARACAMFQDANQSGVLVVTLLEEMPTTETIELVGTIHTDLLLPLFGVVVNGALPVLFSEDERARLLANSEVFHWPARPNRSGSHWSALTGGAFRAIREQAQAQSLSRLTQAVGAPKALLPFLFEHAATLDGLQSLAGLA